MRWTIMQGMQGAHVKVAVFQEDKTQARPQAPMRLQAQLREGLGLQVSGVGFRLQFQVADVQLICPLQCRIAGRPGSVCSMPITESRARRKESIMFGVRPGAGEILTGPLVCLLANVDSYSGRDWFITMPWILTETESDPEKVSPR